ncbi:MAG: nitroreductase family protein [Planctomycetes bacterium]|nr:nitroreductase family protein [Planctomycetota bacterium]
MSAPVFVPYSDRHVPSLPPEEAAREFHAVLSKRRTVRDFSDRPVSQATIEWLVRAAGSAPSGANKQPWRFVAVRDPGVKRRIRAAAEAEEREFYARRASAEWLADLAPLGTDASKPFLEVAPWLVVVFKLTRGDDDAQHYYVNESVGIAVGMFLAAAQHAGLATLTHTPSPMGFLQELLGRPKHEKPFVLIPVGHPADDCRVPAAALVKKPLHELLQIV